MQKFGVKKFCSYGTCIREPLYGFNNNERCYYHKEKGMTCIIKKYVCIYDKCNKMPNFNLPGKPAKFCATHKTPDMINIHLKPCIYNMCKTPPLYGKPGSKPSHCSKHREPGMIKRPNGKCIQCKSPAIYGSNFTAQHCEEHKEEHKQNLVERNCRSCNLIMILDNDNYCEYCNPITFKTARLAKQNALMDFLDTVGLHGTSTDTIIDHGVCGKERPDRVFDFGDKVVLLECDEHQHRDRPSDCEHTRMINLSQSFGGLPVYFIRWNPDNYSPLHDSSTIASIQQRHSSVAQLILDIQRDITPLPHALLSVCYMYYDGWHKVTWNVLLPFASI